MSRTGAVLLVLALLSGISSACAGGAGVPSARRDRPPPPAAGTPPGLAAVGFPFTSFDGGEAISAVPGTRQAWALGGSYRNPDTGVNSLLHVSGLSWTKAATFGPLVQLAGVSAVSGSAAWVWGQTNPNPHGLPHTVTPYLALVSGGVIRQMRVPSRWRYVFPLAVASHGTADAWLSGWARDKRTR